MEPDLPPESVLIRRARSAQGLSPERIVKRLTRISMSGRNWRQIEDGRNVPDETLAHMARAVGLTPERLEEVGRPEAAAILREINRMEADDSTADGNEAELAGFNAAADLPDDPAERMAELRRRLDALTEAAQRLLGGEQEERRTS